jgi:hypothetical protein
MEGITQTSKYNQGVAIIERLDYLWKKVNTYCANGSYSAWNEHLDIIWRELARDLSASDYDNKKNPDGTIKEEGYKTKYDKLDKEIKNLGGFKDDLNETFNKISPEQIKKRNEQYKALAEKDLFLRRLENKIGKGTKFDEDDDYED